MTSPAETVDQAFRWLRTVLGVALPVLPLTGLYRRLTALFELTLSGDLPAPTEKKPWIIPVSENWAAPIPGLAVSIENIRIRVAQDEVASPASPPSLDG